MAVTAVAVAVMAVCVAVGVVAVARGQQPQCVVLCHNAFLLQASLGGRGGWVMGWGGVGEAEGRGAAAQAREGGRGHCVLAAAALGQWQ